MNFRLKPFAPSEHETQKAILEYLRMCPLVAWSGRINSGATKINDGNKTRFIRFNTIEGISDIIGQMKDGRFLSIEVKKTGWKHPKDDHEKKQAEFLEKVNKNGGIGFFATSIEDVIDGLRKKK